MGRVIEISSPEVTVVSRSGFIVFKRQDDETGAALTDIDSIILLPSSRNSVISFSALAKLAAHEALVMSCDEQYYPVGVFCPRDKSCPTQYR